MMQHNNLLTQIVMLFYIVKIIEYCTKYWNTSLTFEPHKSIIYLWVALVWGGEDLTKKKMGRPTDSPKIHEVKARVDDETLEALDHYSKISGKNRAECIREGISRLEWEKPKEEE